MFTYAAEATNILSTMKLWLWWPKHAQKISIIKFSTSFQICQVLIVNSIYFWPNKLQCKKKINIHITQLKRVHKFHFRSKKSLHSIYDSASNYKFCIISMITAKSGSFNQYRCNIQISSNYLNRLCSSIYKVAFSNPVIDIHDSQSHQMAQ